jgi:hypothetical protein
MRDRLEKLERLTGLDTRSFWDLAELAAAAKLFARGPLEEGEPPFQRPRIEAPAGVCVG